MSNALIAILVVAGVLLAIVLGIFIGANWLTQFIIDVIFGKRNVKSNGDNKNNE